MKKVAIEVEYHKMCRPLTKPHETPLTVRFDPIAIKITVDGCRPSEGGDLRQCEIRATLADGVKDLCEGVNDLCEKVEDVVFTIKYFGWEGVVDMVKEQIFSERDASTFEDWIKKLIDALLCDYAERDFEISFDGLREDYKVLKKKFAEAEQDGRLTANVVLVFNVTRILEELKIC